MFAFLAPVVAITILAAMTLIAAVSWLMRRQDRALGWLAFVGCFWIVFSLRSFGPLPGVPQAIGGLAQSVGAFAILLGLSHLAVPLLGLKAIGERLWLAALIALTAAIVELAGQVAGASGVAGLLGTLVMGVGLLAVLASRQRVAGPPDVGVVFAAIAVSISGIAADFAATAGMWDRAGQIFLPYAGVLTVLLAGIAVLRRLLADFAEKDRLNALLGQRIETTKANLLASESARRSLEVSNAVTQERERMMREIHDGIGSSLMAALASAERQGKHDTTAVMALKNALTDLRIAVDSLEPVEGNVATLLASLRYRVEPELRKSGIAFDWMVDDVPELEWLDSPNALHIMRIFQEALGNVLGHANASRIRVSCKMDLLEGRPGIRIDVTDNGDGFDASVPAKGRGRKNMMDRAEALGGKLTIQSTPGIGSSTTLWLPLLRPRA